MKAEPGKVSRSPWSSLGQGNLGQGSLGQGK